jgi:hypothetical protein
MIMGKQSGSAAKVSQGFAIARRPQQCGSTPPYQADRCDQADPLTPRWDMPAKGGEPADPSPPMALAAT